MNEAELAAWRQHRLGKVTASQVSSVFAKLKTGAYGASRETYMQQLLCERLTGLPTESFTSAAMQHGIDTEPLARDCYSAHTGDLVETCGFIDHPTIVGCGASPDGLVGSHKILELKAPNTSTALEYILSRQIPHRYQCQIQLQLACTERAYADFVSYDNRLPEHLQLLIIPVLKDNAMIEMMEDEIKKFLIELDDRLNKLKELKL